MELVLGLGRGGRRKCLQGVEIIERVREIRHVDGRRDFVVPEIGCVGPAAQEFHFVLQRTLAVRERLAPGIHTRARRGAQVLVAHVVGRNRIRRIGRRRRSSIGRGRWRGAGGRASSAAAGGQHCQRREGAGKQTDRRSQGRRDGYQFHALNYRLQPIHT